MHGGRGLWILGGGRLSELGTMLLVVAWTTLWMSRIRRGLVRISMGLYRLLLRRREVDKVASGLLWLEDSRRGLIDSWLLQVEAGGSLLDFTARRIDDATRQRLCCRLENHYLIPEMFKGSGDLRRWVRTWFGSLFFGSNIRSGGSSRNSSKGRRTGRGWQNLGRRPPPPKNPLHRPLDSHRRHSLKRAL